MLSVSLAEDLSSHNTPVIQVLGFARFKVTNPEMNAWPINFDAFI